MSQTSTGPVLKASEEEELGLLKKELRESEMKEKDKYKYREELADKIILYLRSAFWVVVGVVTIYYTTFFHHLFRNPNINELFF